MPRTRMSRFLAIYGLLSFSSIGIALPADLAKWSTTGYDLHEKCASSDSAVAHACGEYLLGLLDGAIMSMPADAQFFCPLREVLVLPAGGGIYQLGEG